MQAATLTPAGKEAAGVGGAIGTDGRVDSLLPGSCTADRQGNKEQRKGREGRRGEVMRAGRQTGAQAGKKGGRGGNGRSKDDGLFKKSSGNAAAATSS